MGSSKEGVGTSYNAFNFDNFSVQYGVCVCLCKERVHDMFVWSRGVGFRGGQTAECSAPAVEAAQTLDCMHNHPVVLLLDWT